MKTIEVPCSISIKVGDHDLPEVIEFTLPVNLYEDDPGADEVDQWKASEMDWRALDRLPYKITDAVERIAIDQAREMQAAQAAECAIANRDEVCHHPQSRGFGRRHLECVDCGHIWEPEDAR